MTTHDVRVTVNGVEHAIAVPAHRMLVDLLRDDLRLTGTKLGCSIGVCGVCSVLVDGQLVSSCLVPAVFVDGHAVTTIEGLRGPEEQLSPLQQAFIRHGGFQCGICTPGQLVAATALLDENRNPSEGEIRRWMKGNLCRCTGYYKILESIESVAGQQVGTADDNG